MISIEVRFCEKEHVPFDYSLTYQRNLIRWGKEIADFYTYPVIFPKEVSHVEHSSE